MVSALSSNALTSMLSGSRVPSSCSIVPLGSSRSLCLKSSSSRLLLISLRSISARWPPPLASVIIRSPFTCPKCPCPERREDQYCTDPLLRARGTPTLGERSASLRHTFCWPDQEGRRFEDDVDTARAAGQGVGAPQLCGP